MEIVEDSRKRVAVARNNGVSVDLYRLLRVTIIARLAWEKAISCAVIHVQECFILTASRRDLAVQSTARGIANGAEQKNQNLRSAAIHPGYLTSFSTT
jgi:hypothetical protein